MGRTGLEGVAEAGRSFTRQEAKTHTKIAGFRDSTHTIPYRNLTTHRWKQHGSKIK